jgi:diaminobutyrate-2-oxoglutarate transaminase
MTVVQERTATKVQRRPALTGTALFEEHESEVRLYCRKFPAVFTSAKNSRLYAEDGRVFIDFFAGAGTLNYGHNHDVIKSRLLDYIARDGIMHGLDFHTEAKRAVISAIQDRILATRGLAYKMQFSAPTGADAVEAALKVARRATGREDIVAFTGGYHGMTLGALSVTGSKSARAASGVNLSRTVFVPYEDGPGGPFDSVAYLSRLWNDPNSGTERPAAVIVEAVQMDGGIYPASAAWLQRLRKLTEDHGVLLICDDIQAGCGRTGTFFSFEGSGITPDVVTLSKSVGGYGLPMSLVLFKPELDRWSPGEHTGTFRGNQLAFVAATAALELWEDPDFRAGLQSSSAELSLAGQQLKELDGSLRVRGRGMVLGVDTAEAGGERRALAVQEYCFGHGVVLELCGRADTVVKVMPPLTIEPDELRQGLKVLTDALAATREGA